MPAAQLFQDIGDPGHQFDVVAKERGGQLLDLLLFLRLHRPGVQSLERLGKIGQEGPGAISVAPGVGRFHIVEDRPDLGPVGGVTELIVPDRHRGGATAA